MSPQQFAHLMPKESEVWAAFLVAHGAEYDRFVYDVHVGQGHPLDPDWPDYIRAMVGVISPKRIDVVGYLGTQPTIFEVSPRDTRTIPGALLMYRYLYRQQFPQDPVPKLAAVLPRVDPDMARYLASEGVTVYLVQPLAGAG